MKASAPQAETPVEVGGILSSVSMEECGGWGRSPATHGLGKGKEYDYRQKMEIHRKGTLLLVSICRMSAFPLLTTLALYLL